MSLASRRVAPLPPTSGLGCTTSGMLGQPTETDAKWFRDMNKFGSYDHSFPRRLVDEQRQRVIGSSDAAFVVELTPPRSNAPRLQPTDPSAPDRFNAAEAHHLANRNLVAIWRAA